MTKLHLTTTYLEVISYLALLKKLPSRFYKYFVWRFYKCGIIKGFSTTCTLGKFYSMVYLVLLATLLYFASSCLVELLC